MKVAILSKADRNGGGASRVAEDLASWLNEAGHQADHFIAHFYKPPLSFQKNLYGGGRRLEACKSIHQITYDYGFPELFPMEYWFNLNRLLDNYDIVHFHDLYKAISPLSLAFASRRKPTFFTVHDCSAFTGGCLYPMNCEYYRTHCHNCPQLPYKSTGETIPDHTNIMQGIKRWTSKNFPIHYVFPSSWMASQAAQILKFKRSPTIVHNGLDLTPFLEQSKQDAKTQLGLPHNYPVITISSHCLDDPRKGVKYAIAALQSIRHLSPIVVTVGFINDELRQALHGLEIREMGYVEDYAKLTQIYSATDVVLFCTLADNLPLTVLEAMAASTPVVGFATGGVPEMIQSGRNGVLVEPGDQAALNRALQEILLSPRLVAMGKQARRDVEANFSKSMFIERHLQMYQDSLDHTT